MSVPIGGHELNRAFEVWRPETAEDGAGGQDVTYALAGSVRGRMSQPSAAERIAAGQAGAVHTTPIYLRPDADVARGDVLHGDGQAYRVKATLAPSESAYLRAEAELIQSEPTEAGS